MEVRWLVLVGAWKTCVTLDLRYATTPDHLSFHSWIREKCTLVCPSSAFPPLSIQHIIFSSSIIEDTMALRDAGRASMAYFYFDFRDVDKQKLQNVHICVTSRPEHDIQIVLKRLTERPVSLHDESGQQEDITNYVVSFVRSNQRMRRWREEDKNLVIKTLSEKADGM